MFSPILPEYCGKYSVGCIDIETKATDPDHAHGLLVRLYYPSKEGSRKASWMPNVRLYTEGYANMFKVPGLLAYLTTAPYFWSLATPAFDASLLNEMPTKMPVLVFSHGLFGMRTSYSTFCGNLASLGFVVIAIEHSDGSAVITARNNFTTKISYQNPFKMECMDGESENERNLRCRREHIAIRTRQVFQTVTLVKQLHAGSFSNADNLLDCNFDMAQFKDRLDLDHLVLAGHSFGGATAISVLEDPSHSFKCALIFDPWMYAVHDRKPPTVPYLTVQSHVKITNLVFSLA